MRANRLALVVLVAALGCSGSAARRTGGPQSRAAPPQGAGGVELYHQGRFAEAEAELTRATSHNPADPEAWAYLGLARVKLERTSEAEEALNRALALDRDHAEAHYGLGLVRARRDQLDGAIVELSYAVRSDPSHSYAHYYLGLAYDEKGRKDLAILHLQRFVDLAPDAPEAPRVRSFLARVQ